MMRFPTGKLELLSPPKKDRWVLVLLLLFGFFNAQSAAPVIISGRT